MSDGALAARARGLTAQVIAGEALAAIDAAPDGPALAEALARADLALPGGAGADAGAAADTIDRLARDRTASDLAILARHDACGALAVIALDEDRRSLRAIVRGIAAGASAERRLAGTVPTARLPAPVLTALAGAATLADAAALLARGRHPLAAALAARPGTDPKGGSAPRLASLDVLEIELGLARRFVEWAARGPRDRAMRSYLAQLVDAENAGAAVLLASRGGDLPAERAFLDAGVRGRRLDRARFLAAAAGPLDAACAVLAGVFAGTPLAAALFAPGPAALEDAALTWQLATQARLRRSEPLGLAPALYAVLRRRDEARHLRRAGWRIALGAAA